MGYSFSRLRYPPPHRLQIYSKSASFVYHVLKKMSSCLVTRFFVFGRKVLPSRPVYSPRLFSSCAALCSGRIANPHYWSEEVASSTHVDTGSITGAISQQTSVADAISQQTSVADAISQQTSVADAISQQTSVADAVSGLASAGLGGYTPVGIIQHALEFLHVQANVPWWVAIAVTAALLRVALLPLAVSMQQNTSRMFNIQPEVSRILLNMQQCSKLGDQVGQAQEGLKLAELYREHRVNPFKMFFMPLVQMPIFLTFFMAIRRMAAAPVESMKTGGLWWFPDLTIPDPTFSLPLLTCVNFLINIEVSNCTSFIYCGEFYPPPLTAWWGDSCFKPNL